jgi:hypothetical protein
LSQAAHQLNERLSGVLEAEGLTPGQWWVLGLLSDGAGHTMSEAADHAMLPAGRLCVVLLLAVDDMAPSFARGHAERRCSGACPQQARPPRPSPSRGPVYGWCP